MWQHLLEEWQRNPVGAKMHMEFLLCWSEFSRHPRHGVSILASFHTRTHRSDIFSSGCAEYNPKEFLFFFCSTRENSWPSPKPKTVESIWLVLLIITNHLPESTMVNSRKWSLSLVPRRHLSLEYGSSSRLLLHFWKSTNWLALEQSQLMKSISRVYAAGIRGFTIGPIKHVVLPSNAFALQETRQKSVGQKPTFLLK